MRSFLVKLNGHRMACLVLSVTLMVFTLQAPLLPLVSKPMPQAEPAPSAAMLQFTSGGHVIGFEAAQVYLAGLDHALHIEFVGAGEVNPQSDAPGMSGKASPLTQVRYPELWHGISVSYQASAAGILESTYRLVPGADAAQIRLRFNVPVELENDGGLRFNFERGWLSESAPVAWQEVNGARVSVAVGFEMVPGAALVGFRLGNYDHTLPLVIDPTYNWHTFYGATSGTDEGHAIAVDGSGNIYMTGYSHSTWQGDSGTAPLHAFSGGADIVVVKLDSSGAYQWHTFYGSGNDDFGYAIAVGTSGNVVVTGYSTATWQGDGGVDPLHAYAGSGDIVVLKLDSSGAYQWHTFYGSDNGYDVGNAIVVGIAGNIMIAGESDTTWQGDSNTSPLHAISGSFDIVVLKLNGSGVYQWHTFYGSSLFDCGYGITADGSGNVYVVGNSAATWQGDSNASPLHAHSGADDIVLMKLNTSGVYIWHTFYGSSSGTDTGSAIALDGTGNIYIAGASTATWQGDGGANPIHAFSGGTDILALKLDNSGAYQWHTFYGGGGDDLGSGIALDGSSNVYLTGLSNATWQGEGNTAPIHAYSGNFDIVVAELNSSGAYQWHTFYGSSGGYDSGNGIAVDGSNNVYIGGFSNATWQGDGNNYPIHSFSGHEAILLLRLSDTGVYQWHTFEGPADGYDEGRAIAVDGSGNVYVAGDSDSNWLGDGGANPLRAYRGRTDIVVVKLDSSGAYQWHTFYGSASYEDEGYGIAVDGSGNVYVTGYSGGNWLGAGGAAPLHAYQGCNDIVVLKLNSAGVYQWHTFYGTVYGYDYGYAIALDGNGNVLVAGESAETWKGNGGANPLHAYSGGAEDFTVLKLDSSGAYQWHTFYGSSGLDDCFGLAVDASGNSYAVGYSPLSWQGDGGANPLHAFSGGAEDITVLKLNSSGAYQWHTFYASDWTTGGAAIALDRNSNVYVTGSSSISWQGDGGANPLHAFNGDYDIVVLKLNSSGAYQWHTFYGSSSQDLGYGIAVDGSGNIYVGGESSDTWQGDGGVNPHHAFSGDRDIVVLKLNSSGAYQWHTFEGSDDFDYGNAVAVDGGGSVYVAAVSYATWQGDGGDDPLHAYSGDSDLVVLKLSSIRVYLPLVVK